jgi:hypothetical protein
MIFYLTFCENGKGGETAISCHKSHSYLYQLNIQPEKEKRNISKTLTGIERINDIE